MMSERTAVWSDGPLSEIMRVTSPPPPKGSLKQVNNLHDIHRFTTRIEIVYYTAFFFKLKTAIAM